MKPYELVFLARAIHNTQQALLGDHPQKEIHAIQAELLLSFYFFQTGHMCEGLAHSNAAAIIVIAYRFHKIRALQSPFAACVGVDSVQEGELINACWASYLVDKSWTAIVPNSVSAFSDEDNEDDRIDSPWPLDMAQYEAVSLIYHFLHSLFLTFHRINCSHMGKVPSKDFYKILQNRLLSKIPHSLPCTAKLQLCSSELQASDPRLLQVRKNSDIFLFVYLLA